MDINATILASKFGLDDANPSIIAKNFSFILRDNTWSFSPAYDLVPSPGFNNQHTTTTINGQGNPSLKDILTVGTNATPTPPPTHHYPPESQSQDSPLSR